MKEEYAGFSIRLLALFLDGLILLLPHQFFWLYIIAAQTLNELIYRFFLYLIILLLPSIIFIFLYFSFFIHFFGGTIGKFLTGARVLNETGEKLHLSRSIFRHTVGYKFSWLLFGLGFLTIIKDPQKQAWHDKAVGSKVIIRQKIWPLALFILILLIGINLYLFNQVIHKTNQSSIKEEVNILLQSTQKPPLPEPTEIPQLPPTQATKTI